MKKTTKKHKKVRADKYEEKLKIHGTFEQAVKILVRDKPNIQPQVKNRNGITEQEHYLVPMKYIVAIIYSKEMKLAGGQ